MSRSEGHHMPKETEKELRSLPGNDRCVDCNTPGPQWASVSYGVFMCLECSGRHRGLGVHISFVRSVSMDAWKDREVRAMQVGGNGKLIAHFKAYGVNSLPIQAKYNTPAAAMYRDIISALKEGRAPPTDIQPYIEEEEKEKADMAARASGSGGSSSMGSMSGGGGGGSSQADREAAAARAKAEASERIRAKFGDGGLKGQSVSNNPYGSVSNNPSSNDDGLDAAALKLTAFAGAALSKLGEAAKVGVKTVAETTSTVARKVQEGQITEKLSGAVGTVTSKVSDPALLSNVQASASSFWSRATAVTSGFLSTASTFVQTQLAAPAPGPNGSAGGNGTTSNTADDDFWANTDIPRSESGAASSGGRGSRATSGAVAAPAAASAPAPAAARADDVDDAEWLAQQVAATASKLKMSSIGSGSDPARSKGAAASSEGWDAAWEEGEGEEDATASEPKLPQPASAPAPAPASTASSKPAAAPAPAAAADGDDFFAQFGIK